MRRLRARHVHVNSSGTSRNKRMPLTRSATSEFPATQGQFPQGDVLDRLLKLGNILNSFACRVS